MKQIIIINRYYPPNPAISGHSACEMVKALSHRNKDLRFLVRYIHAPYAGGLSSQISAGILGGMTSIYNGKNKILRFLGNFVEGYRLVRLSLPYADAIISLTDPPMLNYWAGRLCKKQRIPWIYWSLDLYPDAFASAGIVSNKNIFYQSFQHAIKLNPPDFLIALGAQQAAYIKSKFKKNIPFVRLPCGIIQPKKSLIPPEWYSDNKTVFAYVGNMGEAHDPEFLTQLIFHMDPTRHICLLSLYGAKSNHVLSSVANHPAVRIIDHIPQEHLAYIDIHLVSLLPEWTHVCVPSKAVSAICSGKAIAFQGHRHSDTWKMFKSAAFYIERS
ncbi:MAG: group 1 glycosyl transferase, partial [Candidatus Magnetoglobus multicellularis str. Araruama]